MILKNHLTPKKALFFIIAAGILMLSASPIIRTLSDQPLIIGEKPYYDLRIAETIKDKGLLFNDNLILDGRAYTIEIYHLLITLFSYLNYPEILLILLSILFGISSLILSFLILRRIRTDIQTTFFISLILLMSPAFIFTFSTLNDLSISIFLILLGLYIFITRHNIFASLFVFLIATTINLINILIIFSAILLFLNRYPDKKKIARIIISINLVTGSIYYLQSYFSNNFFDKIEIFGGNDFKLLVSDLGGMAGISIFALVLGIIGLFILWRKKNDLKYAYILAALLIILYPYFASSGIYLSFVITIFGGAALNHLIKLKWNSFFLKEFTILLLILGLLFSTISYENRLILAEPNKDVKKALDWLDNVSGKDVVFSSYNKGFWIQYLSNKKTLTDGLFNYKDAKNKFYDSEEILHSRDIEKTKELLTKYDVKYIFVDPQMKDGGVWSKKEGLWYLLDNHDTFQRLYQRKDVEIWEYKLSSSNRTNFIN